MAICGCCLKMCIFTCTTDCWCLLKQLKFFSGVNMVAIHLHLLRCGLALKKMFALCPFQKTKNLWRVVCPNYNTAMHLSASKDMGGGGLFLCKGKPKNIWFVSDLQVSPPNLMLYLGWKKKGCESNRKTASLFSSKCSILVLRSNIYGSSAVQRLGLGSNCTSSWSALALAFW